LLLTLGWQVAARVPSRGSCPTEGKSPPSRRHLGTEGSETAEVALDERRYGRIRDSQTRRDDERLPDRAKGIRQESCTMNARLRGRYRLRRRAVGRQGSEVPCAFAVQHSSRTCQESTEDFAF
jgi:hypothetical protein